MNFGQAGPQLQSSYILNARFLSHYLLQYIQNNYIIRVDDRPVKNVDFLTWGHGGYCDNLNQVLKERIVPVRDLKNLTHFVQPASSNNKTFSV